VEDDLFSLGENVVKQEDRSENHLAPEQDDLRGRTFGFVRRIIRLCPFLPVIRDQLFGSGASAGATGREIKDETDRLIPVLVTLIKTGLSRPV